MPIKSILFPIDFSDRSIKALEQALFFCSLNKASLLCYHVYHRPSKGEKGAKTLIGRQNEIKVKYEALLEEYPVLKKAPHAFKMELGISTDKIIEIAGSGEVDMIIMATKGAKGFGQLWGSKTASIVRQVDLPVLVLPDNTSLKNVKSIALSYDYRLVPNHHTLETLVSTAELLKADINVISIKKEASDKSDYEKTEEARKKLMKELKRIPHSFSFHQHRDVQEGIMQYAHQHGIGLIFVIPKTYNYLEKAFHESLTTRMVFKSDIPLLIKKHKG